MGPDATDTLFCILISLEADSWVDDGIEDIHQQVDQDEFERKQEHFGLKNRIVPHFHGIHEQTAKAGPVEYLLNHDGTAEQKTTFLVGGAKEVPYEEVIKALNLLHEAGVTSVGLMTNPI